MSSRRSRGGKIDWHHVEPVVEVLAEPAGVDLIEQVAVRGRDDPGVDLLGVVIADPLEFPFLEDAEQLDLELGRGAVDLVEKDRSRVRGLEPSGPVVHRAGERALDVPEELAFQEALGESPAIDADVGARRSGAEVVDGVAISSLPVPVSPTISTQAREGATWRVVRNTSRMAGLSPSTPGKVTDRAAGSPGPGPGAWMLKLDLVSMAMAAQPSGALVDGRKPRMLGASRSKIQPLPGLVG